MSDRPRRREATGNVTLFPGRGGLKLALSLVATSSYDPSSIFSLYCGNSKIAYKNLPSCLLAWTLPP